MTEYIPYWTTDQLMAALLNKAELPDYDGKYDYLYHRETAAHWLNKKAKDSMNSFMDSFGAILYVAAHDRDEDIRLKCLNYVASAQWAGVEAFLVAMSFDPIDDIRQLALEGLAFREFQSFRSVANRLLEDSNSQIREQAKAILDRQQWTIHQLDFD
jgi:hypothetical protein